jgi:hypothetical protein
VATQPPTEENPSLKPASGRLDSWKEIAAYLKREVRTVQRWETSEGLPIHRHLHRSQGSVYAYTSELDAWWHNHTSATDAGADMEGVRPPEGDALSAAQAAGTIAEAGWPSTAIGEPPRQEQVRKLLSLPKWIHRRIRIPLLAASIVLLVGLVSSLLWSLARHGSRLPVASIYLSGNQLVALNSAGTAVWRYDYSRPPVSSTLYPHAPGVTCHDHESDVLVSVAWHDGESHELDCFSNTGTLMWNFTFRDTLTFGTQPFSPPWSVKGVEFLRVNGEGRIAVALNHDVWWPGVVVLLDTQGRTVGTFVNSGWITSLKQVRTSSEMLLLAGGTSNSGDGAMIAVLDPARLDGSSPERSGTIYECTSCGTGRPLKYFILPRSEVNVAAGTKLSYANFDESTERIIARTQEGIGTGRYETAEGILTFSPEMDLVNAVYSDGYWYAHKELEESGAIKHSSRKCPDRFGPRRILSWDAQNGWKEIHPSTVQH